MDSSIILGQIQSLNGILDTQKKVMDEAQSIMLDLDNYISGYKAQRAAVDPSKKKDGERAWYDNKITDLNNQKQTQINRYNTAKATYDDALAKLATAKNNLSDAEKNALNQDAAIEQSKADAVKDLTNAAVAKTAQGTTVYLIWGAVAFVILIFVGLLMYKKFSA